MSESPPLKTRRVIYIFCLLFLLGLAVLKLDALGISAIYSLRGRNSYDHDDELLLSGNNSVPRHDDDRKVTTVDDEDVVITGNNYYVDDADGVNNHNKNTAVENAVAIDEKLLIDDDNNDDDNNDELLRIPSDSHRPSETKRQSAVAAPATTGPEVAPSKKTMLQTHTSYNTTTIDDKASAKSSKGLKFGSAKSSKSKVLAIKKNEKKDDKCKHMFEWSMLEHIESDGKDFDMNNLPQTKHLRGPIQTMTIVVRNSQLKTMVVDLWVDKTKMKNLKHMNLWHRQTQLYGTWVAVQIAQRKYNLMTDRIIYVHDCSKGKLSSEWRNVGELSCNKTLIDQADVTITPPYDGLMWHLAWDFSLQCFGSEMFSAYASIYTDRQSKLDPTEAMGCWIDRQTGARKVANLDDVLSTMREVFPRVEVITFTADKTGNETAEMIKECRVLFGVHGAGHTNAIYARPGVAVIEAIGTIKPAYYRNINMLLDQHYQSIIGDKTKKITDTDWKIDLDEAKAALIKARAHTDEWIKEHGHWR